MDQVKVIQKAVLEKMNHAAQQLISEGVDPQDAIEIVGLNFQRLNASGELISTDSLKQV